MLKIKILVLSVSVLLVVVAVSAQCPQPCNDCQCSVGSFSCTIYGWNACSDSSYPCTNVYYCGTFTNLNLQRTGTPPNYTRCASGKCWAALLTTQSSCNGVNYQGTLTSCCTPP
jgi:hypothetical protein